MSKIRGIVLVSVVTALFALTGCGVSFDHAAYVKAMLDASYKAEFDEYIELTKCTPEEAKTQYDQNMDAIVNDICSALAVDISEQNRAKLSVVMESIFKAASYEVLGAERVADDEYSVEIKIKPITNFLEFEDEMSGYAEDFIGKISDSEFDDMTPEEIYAVFMDGLILIMETGSQTIGYAEETSISVPVRINNDLKKWYIPDEEQERIFNCIVSM